jgi:hypothetical protein
MQVPLVMKNNSSLRSPSLITTSFGLSQRGTGTGNEMREEYLSPVRHSPENLRLQMQHHLLENVAILRDLQHGQEWSETGWSWSVCHATHREEGRGGRKEYLSNFLKERNLIEQPAVDMSQHSKSELWRQLIQDQPLTQQIVSLRFTLRFEIKKLSEFFF